MKRLSHIGDDGSAQMVDVSAKEHSAREAVAAGQIRLQQDTLDLIARNKIGKGNVLTVARIAGIQAAKQTSQLIPLCHNLNLSHVEIEIATSEAGLEVKCVARTVAQTGVEMEALTGVAVTLLTIYDMCKAVDKEMQITDIRLLKKTKTAVAAVSDRRKN
jgi:cyclic pyranopterin phosphate synthase